MSRRIKKGVDVLKVIAYNKEDLEWLFEHIEHDEGEGLMANCLENWICHTNNVKYSRPGIKVTKTFKRKVFQGNTLTEWDFWLDMQGILWVRVKDSSRPWDIERDEVWIRM